MNLDYTKKVEVKMYMRKYVIITISEFPMNIEKVQAVTISATQNLFNVDGIKPLENNKV